ncbi:MAG: MarR family transcriptional regulator [Acidimicrobiales bacterium]
MEETTAETAARLRRAVTRLNRRLRGTAPDRVSPGQASMLASIAKLANPSLGDLASAEHIQPPSVTRLVRDMQRQGLITCTLDVDDRRCTRVSLTAAGRRELDTIRMKKAEFLEQRLLALSATDQRRARDAATFLETLLDER